MKADPAVTRLSAGLDRDEQLARDVLDLEKPYRDLAWEGVTAEIRYKWVRHTKLSTGGAGSIFLEGAPSPQHVLRQVDAIRKALAAAADPDTFASSTVSDAVDYTSFREGVEAATELFTAALASIYEEATETGGRP